MRNTISYAALGVALVAGSSVAQAQAVETVITQPGPTVIAQEPIVPPPAVVVTQPSPLVQTVPVETVETVRTVRRSPRRASRSAERVTTTRTTIVREAVVAAAPVVAEAPYAGLYNAVPATAGTVVPTYRYVYEPDRILVIDPYTNITVQAIPR